MPLEDMFIAESLIAVRMMANEITFSEMSDISMGGQCFFLIPNRERRNQRVTITLNLTDLKSLSQPSTSHCQSLPCSPPLRVLFNDSSLFPSRC